jgi:hypothetical protein
MYAADTKHLSVGMTKAAADLQAWKLAHSLGRFRIDPLYLSNPAKSWAARRINLEHLVTLRESFMKAGTVNHCLLAVITDAKLLVAMQEQRLLGVDPDSTLPLTITDLSTMLQCSPTVIKEQYPLMTAQGNHTRVTLLQLGSEYPTQAKYKLAYMQILIVQPEDDTTRFLTMIGNLDNIKCSLKPDFAQSILGIHDRNLEIEQGNRTPESLTQLRIDLSYSLALNPGDCGHYFVLGGRTGDCWDAIEELLKGNFLTNTATKIKNKPPTSVAHFTSIGNLPDEVVVKLLKCIQYNEISWVAFGNEILKYKMCGRIRREVADRLSTTGAVPKLQVPKRTGAVRVLPVCYQGCDCLTNTCFFLAARQAGYDGGVLLQPCPALIPHNQ